MENTTIGNERLVALLAAVSSGDDKAFGELHRLTHVYLFMVALRVLRQPVRAEEVLQEAYLSIWTQAWRFRPGLGTPMTWLITIVRNHALDLLRSEQRERRLTGAAGDEGLDEEAVEPAEPSEAEDDIERAFFAVRRCRLRSGIAQLPAAHRQSVVLAFDHGMSHAEVAAHLGAPLGTVKSWLRRGLACLRITLERDAAQALHAAE